jgi:peptidyl-prolyl cis-trans isomerase C
MFRSPTIVVSVVLVLLTMVLKDTLAFSLVQSKTAKRTTMKGNFQPSTISLSPTMSNKSPTALSMGMFDSFSKAFQNTEYGPPAEQVRATARHILVPTKEEAQIVMKMISSGEQTFEECAQSFSTCPSASKGGSLGNFGPGTMVKEFDQVIFNPETKVGEVMGPVLTQFGHHVIVVEKRTGGGDWY